MALLEDYYELVERDTKAVSPLWKGIQIVCYVTAAISGYISGVFFIVVCKSYAMNCFLFANLEFESNATAPIENVFSLSDSQYDHFPKGIPEIHTVLTTWSRPATCEFVGYTPLLSTIFGAIWVTLFCMCPRGGEGSLSRLVRPWRIVYPALAFSIMFAIVQSISTILFHLGVERFCREFSKVLNISQCSSEINIFSLTYNQRMSATYENLMVSLIASYITVCAWVSACLTLIMRFLCVVDFDFVKISVEKKYENKKDDSIRAIEPDQTSTSAPSQESPTWSQDIPTHQTQVSILSYIDDSKSPTTPTQLMDTKNETKEIKNTDRDLEKGRDWSKVIYVPDESKSILFYPGSRHKSENDPNKKDRIQFDMSGTSQQMDVQKEYELSNTAFDTDSKYTVLDLEKRRESSVEKNVARESKSKIDDDRSSQIKKDSNKKKDSLSEKRNTENIQSEMAGTSRQTNEPKELASRNDRRESVNSEKRSKLVESEKTKESKNTALESENRHTKSDNEGKTDDQESEETSTQNAPAQTTSTSQQTNEETNDSQLEAILKAFKFFSR